MHDNEDAASRFTVAADGLRLHYRDLGPASSLALPVVCLPGLTRTARDFDVLAAALATGISGTAVEEDAPPPRVLEID